MASDLEMAKEVPPPPRASYPSPPRTVPADKCMTADVGLRFLLFASTLTALIVMVTSEQTVNITVAGIPFPVRREAKFNQSPAFIYFVAALSAACLYSIITFLASVSVIMKPSFSTSFLLSFAIFDVVVLGLVASATGSVGSVAYIGLKGNSHTQWNEVCNTFDNFCRRVGSSIAVSLFASFVLVFLVILSIRSLHKKIPK